MKRILITGASRGIGLELTKQNLIRGHYIYASCRNPTEPTELMSLQSQYKDRIEILTLDVEDEDSVKTCLNGLKKKDQSIDLLFNNAGIMDWSNFEDISCSSLEKIYKVNLLGTLLVTRNAISCLQQSPAPIIVNLSSRLGSIELRGGTQLGGAIAYQCSKAALNMLTKQMSIDLKPLNIRVISQSPGWVKTEMGGTEAKYRVQDAVSMMLNALESLPKDQTGIFIGEDGVQIPW
jgi:NAD(P)-dependent dehydrogenase (short-subunit alcohol dehydrogenase family)